MKLLSKFLLLAVLLTATVSCSDDDDAPLPPPQGDETIADIVADNPDFSNLLAALEATNLVSEFEGEGELTVFAPNNAAFTAFLETNGYASLGEVPEDVLTEVLLNHVVSGVNLSSDLSTGYINSLGTGSASDQNLSLFINTENGVDINGVSSVVDADIEASNGVVHSVDAVIGLPSVVTQAGANPQFSSLVAALQRASDNTDIDYFELLASSGDSSPFTVFAPTNQAFDDLLSALGAESLEDVEPETLATVLNYHVLAASNVRSSDLTDGLTAETFQGEDLEFDLSDGAQIIDATEMNANIAVTDVQTNNGVVHAIDKVLIPQEILDVIDPTIAGLAMMNENLSSLLAALQYTGLDETLADRSAEFTVFAPTNEAFATFLDGAELTDLPEEAVRQILLNHVLTGVSLSGDLETDYTNSLASYGAPEDEINLSFYINTDDGVRLNGVSSVTGPDNEAANGVVHIVDAVIDLPTVVTFAAADPNFSALAGALEAADTDFITTLSTQGEAPAPFTVFAPINDAFDAITVPDEPTLSAVLSHHVITESNLRSTDLADGAMVETFEGSDITVTLPGTGDNIADLTDGAGNTGIGVIAVDVQAINGVIHAIDSVLLPAE